MRTMLSIYGLIFTKGGFDLNPSRTLNDIFPAIRAKKVRELVEEAWGQK
jgi:hypothetical protein